MQIPFVNGIVPGKNERWKQLYPTVFRLFLAEMNDTATGLLDTPEISGMVCKPVSIEFEHTGTIRDGVMCTARWIETQDELADPGRAARINVAGLEAINLDALSAQLPPNLPPDDISFEELMNNITGVVDTIGSKITILANKPNQILYRIKRLRDSVERAGSALYWPVHDTVDRLEEAVRELPKTPDKIQSQFNRRKVLRYTAQFRSTVPMLAALTSNSVDDIINLNPSLLSRPAVAPGTVVRYYQSSIPLG
jgi:hypothetical protein